MIDLAKGAEHKSPNEEEKGSPFKPLFFREKNAKKNKFRLITLSQKSAKIIFEARKETTFALFGTMKKDPRIGS